MLIPWNTCGATQSSVLGVATLTYLPYAFFCYLSPLMSILFAWCNIKIRRLVQTDPGTEAENRTISYLCSVGHFGPSASAS